MTHSTGGARAALDLGRSECETAAAEARSDSMEWLDQAALDAIYDAAVAADLVDRDTRTVLLQGIDDDIRLALPDHNRPDRQFRSDLQQLNRRVGESVPLRAWLAEAAQLAEGRPAAAVFAGALERPDPPAESSDPSEPAGEGTPGTTPSDGSAVDDSAASLFDRHRVPILAGASALGIGVIVALALGGRAGPDVADAGPADAAVPVDAGSPAVDAAPDRPPLRLPLAVRVAEASRFRPALYRVAAGSLTVRDFDGPRAVGAAHDLAWSRTPVTGAQFRAATGGLPAGAAADDKPLVGASARELRTYCDSLSRAEGRRPFYAEGAGDGYRLPDDSAWVFTCSGGASGPPAPTAWGIDGLGAIAEVVAVGDELSRRTGGGAAGIAACTGGREGVGESGLPAFRVVRPLAGAASVVQPIPRP